jgi:hydrogenase maturation protease
MSPILVLCLGNEVLSDDAFGFHVSAELRKSSVGDRADVEFAAVAGFALLDLLQGRRAALIVDTVVSGNAVPGTLRLFRNGFGTATRHLVSSHQMSLPTALRFGAILGYDMPGAIDVLAVEALDVQTLSESMTPAVAPSIGNAVTEIEKWVQSRAMEMDHVCRYTQNAVG